MQIINRNRDRTQSSRIDLDHFTLFYHLKTVQITHDT
ncbi:Uncharacterised protein [Vibrio cholerae]|nr:Uncharacterised protein [Vibrio cholerae]CSI57562.1 Uncharacterised protein [Vibrio cholerae]